MDGMHVFLLITVLALLVFIVGLVFGIRLMQERPRPPQPPYW